MPPSAAASAFEDAAFAGTLSTRLFLARELVALKLFLPPQHYGSYLAFADDGEPVGVLRPLALDILLEARGTPVRELLAGEDGRSSVERLDAVSTLVERGLLTPRERPQRLIHVLAPDQMTGTRHRGPGAERFIRYFYDYLGGVFHEGSPAIDSPDAFLAIWERYFPSESGLRCLDAGCGSGFAAAALARRGNHLVACDISSTRLAAAAQQPVLPGTLETLQCNLEHIPLPDASMDFVMSSFVLEHVADPYAVLDELVRLLHPGGMLVFSVPSLNVRDTLMAWLYGEVPSLNFEHLRTYGLIPRTHPWCEPTPETLMYLRSKGMTISRVESFGILDGLWEPWRSALGAIEAALGPAFSTTWPWNCLGRQTFIGARAA